MVDIEANALWCWGFDLLIVNFIFILYRISVIHNNYIVYWASFHVTDFQDEAKD